MTCALEAAHDGWDTTLIDPDPGRGAGWVAAGMLAPTAEAHFGEEALVRLLVAGAAAWPGFAAALEHRTGHQIGFEPAGTVVVAKDGSDRADLRRIVEFQRSLGLGVDDLRSDDLHRLEPNLSPSLAGGALLPGDHQVSNRRLLRALVEGCVGSGVTFVHAAVTDVSWSDAQATVRLDTGESMTTGALLLTLGAKTGLIDAIASRVPTVRPVKGHILRLRSPEPILGRTIRAIVRGRNVYLVPRQDGELVVGATVEERGFDDTVQAGEVYGLLDDARRVLPGLDELELVESACGFRPATSSNGPIIERIDHSPVLIATGHFRNGILLAPLTAQIIVGELNERPHPAARLVEAASQDRP